MIYFVSGGAKVYSALDWGQTGSAVSLAALVLFLGIPVVHTFCFSLYTLRVLLQLKRKCLKWCEKHSKGNNTKTRCIVRDFTDA